jgi:hypothetical protein
MEEAPERLGSSVRRLPFPKESLEDSPEAYAVRQLIELAACELAVEALASEALPQLACDLLLAGADTPSLGMLAGQSPSDVRRSRDLFLSTLDELGVTMPDKQTAYWRLVRQAATNIVAGKVSPAEAAEVMWQAYTSVEESGDLRVFVGLLSELDSHPESRAMIEARIVQASEDLLNRISPRQWIKLMAQPGRSPLTITSGHSNFDLDPDDAPVPQGLWERVMAWADRLDRTLAGWPTSGGFRSPADAEAFVADGRALVDELQAALGPGYVVEYMPEPIRPPGLKLRTV